MGFKGSTVVSNVFIPYTSVSHFVENPGRVIGFRSNTHKTCATLPYTLIGGEDIMNMCRFQIL